MLARDLFGVDVSHQRRDARAHALNLGQFGCFADGAAAGVKAVHKTLYAAAVGRNGTVAGDDDAFQLHALTSLRRVSWPSRCPQHR